MLRPPVNWRIFKGDGYIPDRGGVIWLDFDPALGQEQRGRRPMLVVSPLRYNRLVRLAIGFPITSRRKGYQFEVEIPDGLPFSGVVLSDQIKSFSWSERRAELIGPMPAEVKRNVLEKLEALLRD